MAHHDHARLVEAMLAQVDANSLHVGGVYYAREADATVQRRRLAQRLSAETIRKAKWIAEHDPQAPETDGDWVWFEGQLCLWGELCGADRHAYLGGGYPF